MQTDGQTDMTKLVVAFRNFANAPKTAVKLIADNTDFVIYGHAVWFPNPGDRKRKKKEIALYRS
jgi:hypothetical protein